MDANIKLNRDQTHSNFEKLAQELGKTDSQRLRQLIKLISGTDILLSDVLEELYPEKDPQKALDALRAFRQRINQAATDSLVQLHFVSDTQKQLPPSERFCWFEGRDFRTENLEQYSKDVTSHNSIAFIPQRAIRLNHNHHSFSLQEASSNSYQPFQSPPSAHIEDQDVEILPYLLNWVSSDKTPPRCVLLGEYGMGKTTTCHLFAQAMIEQRKNNPGFPLPIYIDLREYTWDGKVDFTLHEILTLILRKSWQTELLDPLSADYLLKQVREERAAMIFDGLDEVLIHMSPKLGQDFIRQLWKVQLPLTDKLPSGKLLFTCRTHYYRGLQEQNNFLSFENRDGFVGKTEDILILQLFDNEQIQTYLQQNLEITEQLPTILTCLQSIYNLFELAQRPFLLSLIRQYILEIGETKFLEQPHNSSLLYQQIIKQWLLRDEGKHQLNSAHKQLLMEYLAVEFWRQGIQQWNMEQLEEWFDNFLFENPGIAGAYQTIHRELLKQDLRTATFLIRKNQDDHFYFAHPSLQEYFLACALERSLWKGKRSLWKLPLLSEKTMNFLIQLFQTQKEHRKENDNHLKQWLSEYDAQSSKLIFLFWLELTKHDPMSPSPPRIQIQGEDFSTWKFVGSPETPLHLCDVDFSQCNLNRSVFQHVNLTRTSFQHASLQESEFCHCTFQENDFSQAILTSSLWRCCEAQQLDFRHSSLEHLQWIRNRTHDCFFPSPFPSTIRVAPLHSLSIQSTSQPVRSYLRAVGTSFSNNPITSVFFRPENQHLICGNEIGSIYFWDLQNRNCFQILRNQKDQLRSMSISADGYYFAGCTKDGNISIWELNQDNNFTILQDPRFRIHDVIFNPHSTCVASWAQNHTIQIWEIQSQSCLHVFQGHTNQINSLVFNSTGTQIISGASDHTLRIWDLQLQKCLHILEGHQAAVSSVLLSRDGKVIVSGSEDQTLRIWELESGKCLHVLKGHAAPVKYTAFSPDGQYLVSRSSDQCLQIWNTKSWECINTLPGNPEWGVNIQFSPDWQHMVSYGEDNRCRVWDLASGKCLLTLLHFPNEHTAAIDENLKRIVFATSEAWRWLHYQETDPSTQKTRSWPSEILGALPGTNTKMVP